MTIAPGSVAPADTLVTPLVAQLAVVAQQIQGVTQVYTEPPDRAPVDGSVLFPLREWVVEDDTNAKLRVRLTFECLHLFLRNDLAYALAQAYQYLPAWLNVLTAWSNNQLGGLAITTSLVGQPATVKGYEWAGEPYIAISTRIAVLTEFVVNTN